MEYEGPHDLNNLPPEERERIINEIIEQVIKPQLEDMGAMFQDAEGEAFVFGSSDKDQAEETIQKINDLLQDGLNIDYILQEMTDLKVSEQFSKQVGEMTINFINIDQNNEAEGQVESLSPEQLRDMFENS